MLSKVISKAWASTGFQHCGRAFLFPGFFFYICEIMYSLSSDLSLSRLLGLISGYLTMSLSSKSGMVYTFQKSACEAVDLIFIGANRLM